MTDIEEIEAPGVEEPIVETPGEPADDMQQPIYSKAQVSKLIARERLRAQEQLAKKGLNMQSQQDQAPQAQQQQQAPAMQQQAPQGIGGMQGIDQAAIERMIAEKAPQLLHDHVQNLKNEHTINSFVSKMQAAEQKHPGLEAKLNELDYSSMAPLVHLANDMENTGDIMKELVDNPMKLGNMLALAQMQPGLAKRQMMELSNSIKTNQEALAQEKQAQDPMSQLKPSSSAGMDNGAMSVTDFRKMFR